MQAWLKTHSGLARAQACVHDNSAASAAAAVLPAFWDACLDALCMHCSSRALQCRSRAPTSASPTARSTLEAAKTAKDARRRTVGARRDARGAHAAAAGADAEQIIIVLPSIGCAAVAGVCPHAQRTAAGRRGGPACGCSQRTADVCRCGGGWAAAGGGGGGGARPACREVIGGTDRDLDK